MLGVELMDVYVRYNFLMKTTTLSCSGSTTWCMCQQGEVYLKTVRQVYLVDDAVVFADTLPTSTFLASAAYLIVHNDSGILPV